MGRRGTALQQRALSGRSWRRRHRADGGPTVPPRPPRSAVVYECSACLTRYLGAQYCSECRRFCRRVGAGGLCPHCDEPVAVADLIADDGR